MLHTTMRIQMLNLFEWFQAAVYIIIALGASQLITAPLLLTSTVTAS